MDKLTSESVADALMACYSGFNRKIGFAFATEKRKHEFALSLQRQYSEGSIPAAQYKRGSDVISFDTGSSIRMFNAGVPGSLYGQSFDYIVYDAEISDDDILAHLKSCERHRMSFDMKGMQFEQWAMRNAEQPMEIDEQPIDDFLNEFSIMKA